MSFYEVLSNNIGKCVKILCHDDYVYHGYIDQVDETHVYLRPLGIKQEESEDTSYFFLGAALISIPFTTIEDISFNPFHYW